jgi:hypothetical protein
MKRIKDLFSAAKSMVPQASETRTYVRLFTDAGVKFAEVQDRDPAKLTLPDDTHHFKFFDRKLKKGEQPDPRNLFSGAENVSPTYFLAERVLPMAMFMSLPPEEKEKLTSEVNPEHSASTCVAINGGECRFLHEEESSSIIVDKKTMKQLWPQHESSQLSNAPKRQR